MGTVLFLKKEFDFYRLIGIIFKVKIYINAHTLKRAKERGATKEEIEEVIKTGFPIKVRYGREGRAKIFNFNKERNGVYYEQKRVEVIFVKEEGSIMTVTVYVFYGKWEV
ncbi:MAG: hypothetical protein DRI36_00680 [Caldiserica bacterium]|nr:MAG: hypothetical protein DRI36_00680 [Caldisericota bacterium]